MSRQSSVRRHEAVKSDQFPLLEAPEISMCLHTCGLDASEDDISRPTPMFVQGFFQQAISKYLGISPAKMRHRQQVLLQSDEHDQFEDSINLLSLQSITYKFLTNCGVYDFTVSDLIKPEPNRTKRLLSAVVNFARFRDEHLDDNEQYQQENFEIFNEFQKKFEENNILKDQINILENRNNKINNNMDQLNNNHSKLEHELRNLKKIQESLTNEHLNYKTEKSRLIQSLEDHNYLLLESKKDLDKMKNYIIESPDIISKIIQDMNNSLSNDQQALNDLELRSRKLAITIESFNIIKQDLKNCYKLIDELNIEINKENEHKNKLNSFKESIEEKNLKLNDLNRRIQLFSRQIKNIEEKTQRTTQQRDEKYNEFENKIKESHDIYGTLLTEKNLNDREMSKKKQYINSIQFKMNELEINYKKEYNDTNLEIQKLNSHLKLYLTQLEKKLTTTII